jgi:hypothetical protein
VTREEQQAGKDMTGGTDGSASAQAVLQSASAGGGAHMGRREMPGRVEERPMRASQAPTARRTEAEATRRAPEETPRPHEVEPNGRRTATTGPTALLQP